jgi:hypothetical protein
MCSECCWAVEKGGVDGLEGRKGQIWDEEYLRPLKRSNEV